MNDETLAALERAAELCGDEAERWGETVHNHLVVQCRKDAALIRALIERERAGGEQAQIVAWLRLQAVKTDHASKIIILAAVADEIASGAHVTVNSVHLSQRVDGEYTGPGDYPERWVGE